MFGRWRVRSTLFIVVGALAACAAEPVAVDPCTPAGTLLFRLTPCAPRPLHAAGDPVQVYSTEAQITAPYQVLGTIHITDPGKYQNLGTADALAAVEDRAHGLGANAVVIDDYHVVYSGIFSRGFDITARAVRVSG